MNFNFNDMEVKTVSNLDLNETGCDSDGSESSGCDCDSPN